MLTERINTSNYSFFDKLKVIDYFMIIIIMAIGAISVFAIYSTESGKFSYYTKNHLIRLLAFFVMFLVFSFIRICIPSKFIKNFSKSIEDDIGPSLKS